MAWFGRGGAKRRQSDFEKEVLPHLDALYSAALRLTRSPEDAEDLVQDAVLKAFRFYDRFEAGTNFRAWLQRILINTFINRYRRAARERKAFEGPMAQPVGDGVMSRAALRRLREPVSEAERRLLAAEIEAALERLPEEYRLIVLLADVEELTYREIAEVLGCPIGTVMSRLHRARGAMKTQLVAQARSLGILSDEVEPDDESEQAAEPVSLDRYRRQREAAR